MSLRPPMSPTAPPSWGGPPTPFFKVSGPKLVGFKFDPEGAIYDSAWRAEERANELARLHHGHEFHVLKVVSTRRVPTVTPSVQVTTYAS